MTKADRISKQSDLITRIQQGDNSLIIELWELIQPLVTAVIRRYMAVCEGSPLFDEEDLRQDAFIALRFALDYWKPDGGASFGAVFVYCIQNATRATRGRRIPDALTNADSLNEPIGEDSEDEMVDLLEDRQTPNTADAAIDNVYMCGLREIFDRIDSEQQTPEQRATIHSLYYQNQTVPQTAAQMGISAADVRSAHDRALRVYRKPYNRFLLEPYTGVYHGVGLTAFKNRRASIVESEAERRDRQRRKFVYRKENP